MKTNIKEKLNTIKKEITKTYEFSINDFEKRYSGSFFGIIWAYIQPIITILIYWIVFQFGFRQPPVGNAPYLLWFTSGLVPWLYFCDIIQSSQGCLLEYSYLVKKVVFNIHILPVMKVCVSTAINIFFIFLVFVIYGSFGYHFDLYCLQVFYYVICLIVLALGLSYLICSITVFFRDFGQIVNIVLQMGMWLVPIAWPIQMIPIKFQWVIKLNPFFYIIQGFRDSYIDKVFFWSHPTLTIYFWVVALFTLWLGITIFNKLKPHFADIL